MTSSMTATRTVARVCHLCEARCGLLLEVDDERVLSVRGDDRDPFSQGYLCPKGAAIGDTHADPDRLRRPLVRDAAGELMETDWDTALDRAAEGLSAVRERHGDAGLGIYLGNPTVHSPGSLFAPLLVRSLGRTPHRYSASTVDQRPQEVVNHLLYGHQQLFAIPDVDRTDLLLVVGANPAVSNGSLLTAPDMRRRIAAIRERGGTVVVVDPRRTETARLADEHHFVRPGSDPLFAAALVHTVLEEGLAADLDEHPTLAGLVHGVDAVREAVAQLSPEAVAERTGMDPATTRRLARAFADAPSAVAYGRVGVHHQRHGTTGAWLLDVLNVVTGNLDRPGGKMFSTPALDLVGDAPARPYGRWTSRINGVDEFAGELPSVTMADEMLTPGEGQLRGMVVNAGNPVLSVPGGERLDEAFADLEFLVCIDLYVTETSRHADVVLPPTSPLERSHYDHAFNALACRNVVSWDDPVFERDTDAMHDHEVFLELAARLTDQTVDEVAGRRYGPARTPAEVVAAGIAAGPQADAITFEQLREADTTVDLGPLEPRLPARLLTNDGRIDIAPQVLLDDLALAVDETLAADVPELLLIGRRHLRSNNSWMHNSERLVKGGDRCTLLLHPDDASHRGLTDGQRVVVRSRVGEVEVPLEVSDEVMPGVASLPHGWGHGRDGVGWRTAAANPGASLNDVTDPELVDAVSGNAACSEVPVEVTPA